MVGALAFAIISLIQNPQVNLLVTKYNLVPGMDYQIELVIENQEKKILLDCQSFVSGLHSKILVGEKWSDEWFILLGGNSCELLMENSIKSIEDNQPFCLKVNLEEKVVTFVSDPASCQEKR